MNDPQPVEAKIVAQPHLQNRPSPYLKDMSFRFTVFVFKFCAAVGFLFGGIGVVALFFMFSTDNPEKIPPALNAVAYLLIGGAVFAGMSFGLSILCDIEQHTFRAAQCLDKIVQSQSRKKSA